MGTPPKRSMLSTLELLEPSLWALNSTGWLSLALLAIGGPAAFFGFFAKFAVGMESPAYSALAIVGCAFIVIGHITWKVHCDAGNGMRDRLARSLMQTLERGGAVRQFALFLRPFRADGRLPVTATPTIDTARDVFSFGLLRRSGLEGLLVRCLKSDYPVVQIGLQENLTKLGSLTKLRLELRHRIGALSGADGAHRDAWKDDFRLLAKNARVCLLVPPDRVNDPGAAGCETEWELRQIVENGWLQKTILLMPAQDLPAYGPGEAKTSRKCVWENAVAVVGDRAALPSRYLFHGALVVPTDRGHLAVRGLDGRRWDRAHVLRRVLLGGELTRSAWLDALHLAFQTVVAVPLTLLFAGLVCAAILELEQGTLGHLALWGGAVCFYLLEIYQRSWTYLLDTVQSWILFLASVGGFLISGLLVEYLADPWLDRWLHLESMEAQAITSTAIFVPVIILITTMLVWLVLRKRPRIQASYSLGDRDPAGQPLNRPGYPGGPSS